MPSSNERGKGQDLPPESQSGTQHLPSVGSPISRARDLRSNAVAIDDGSVVEEVERMPARTKPAVPSSVLNDIAKLKQRVSWLEAALKPSDSKPPVDRVRASLLRGDAEESAKRDALREFYEQRRIADLRQNPHLVEIIRQREREQSAFLRSKGLKPDPTDLPEEFRAKKRKPKA